MNAKALELAALLVFSHPTDVCLQEQPVTASTQVRTSFCCTAFSAAHLGCTQAEPTFWSLGAELPDSAPFPGIIAPPAMCLPLPPECAPDAAGARSARARTLELRPEDRTRWDTRTLELTQRDRERFRFLPLEEVSQHTKRSPLSATPGNDDSIPVTPTCREPETPRAEELQEGEALAPPQ